VGVLLARRHFPGAAEIHLMAVDPGWHRRGIGRALVAALEADLIADLWPGNPCLIMIKAF
jgi:ribosomal protein S18 acetylase RimI-like enzyme